MRKILWERRRLNFYKISHFIKKEKTSLKKCNANNGFCNKVRSSGNGVSVAQTRDNDSCTQVYQK